MSVHQLLAFFKTLKKTLHVISYFPNISQVLAVFKSVAYVAVSLFSVILQDGCFIPWQLQSVGI